MSLTLLSKRVTCPSLILDGHVLCDFVVKLFWEGVCLISRWGNRGELIALTGTVIHSDSSRSTSDWHSALGLCLTGVFWLTNEHRSPELSTVTIERNKQGESETEAKTRPPLPSNVVYMLVCGCVWYLWEQNCGTRILNQRTPVANGCMSRVPVSWTAEELLIRSIRRALLTYFIASSGGKTPPGSFTWYHSVDETMSI